MTVLVDADACPVKRIIVEEARRRGVSVTMLTDTSHVLREDYAAVVTVEKGRDSVDFKLVTLCGAGDVVVTQDYGVAAMALGRGARCLNQNGLLYTNGNTHGMKTEKRGGAGIIRPCQSVRWPTTKLSAAR